MHVGKKNPRHPYYMSSNGLKSVEMEKDLGIMIMIIDILNDYKYAGQDM